MYLVFVILRKLQLYMSGIPKSVFSFLNELKLNNDREWFTEQKDKFKEQEALLKNVYNEILEGLNQEDEIEKMKIFRIYKDVRFSKDKTPYNIHRSVSFSRLGAKLRGGYYLRLEPGNSYVAGGFFSPNATDLLRIRKEFEMDDEEIRTILNAPDFKEAYGGFNTSNQVKTAPKGFSKEHPAIDLIKNKSFFVTHPFTDKETQAKDFSEQVLKHYRLLRPFFDYMSDVLTTNLNGESLLED